MIERHNHDGINSEKVDPKNLQTLPLFSAVPSAAKAPPIFIYVSGATKRLYVKHGATLSYVALT